MKIKFRSRRQKFSFKLTIFVLFLRLLPEKFDDHQFNTMRTYEIPFVEAQIKYLANRGSIERGINKQSK